MNDATSAILREILDVIDDILGVNRPRFFRRPEVLKCVFTEAQLDIWKQAETMEEKALAEEAKVTAASEKEFFAILSKQFGEESNKFFADPATQESIRQLSNPENWFYNKDGSPHRPKPAVWKKYKEGAEKYLGANVAKKVKTRLTISLKEVYQVVKKLNADGVLNIPFKWTATDKKSTEELAKDVLFWVSDANGRHFEPAVAATTQSVMAQGLGFRETEDEMKKALGSTYKDKSDSYWFLMGSVGVQRARSFSKLSAFEDAGVTQYEIWAVLDNRTTPQCRYMNGRVFSLSHGQKIRDNTESSTTPDGVRLAYPWVRYSTSRAAKGLDALYVNQAGARTYLPASNMKPNNPTQPVKGNITASQKGTLNGLVPLPPYHGHCILRGTPVLTLTGWKRIEDVVEGDYVLTHRERYRRVTGTLQHLYTGIGLSFANDKGWSGFTSDHPFLFKDGDWKPGDELLRSDEYEIVEDLPDLPRDFPGLPEQEIAKVLFKTLSSGRQKSEIDGTERGESRNGDLDNADLRKLREEIQEKIITSQEEDIEILLAGMQNSRSYKSKNEILPDMRKEIEDCPLTGESGSRYFLFDELSESFAKGRSEIGGVQKANVGQGKSDVREVSRSPQDSGVSESLAGRLENEEHVREEIRRGTRETECRVHIRTDSDQLWRIHLPTRFLHSLLESLGRGERVVQGEGREEIESLLSGSGTNRPRSRRRNHQTRRDGESQIVTFPLEDVDVFDLEVDEDESFVIGGGLIAHNCRTTYVITEKAIQQLTQTQIEEKQPVGQPPFDVSKVKDSPKGTTGSHGAYWTTDPATGKNYLFKPPTFGKGDADAYMNLAVGQLMKEVGLETPDFFVSEHKGKPVSIQSEIKKIAHDFNGVSVTAMKPEQVLEVQKNFVVDWLTGNFDGNRDNHVAKTTGKVVGVDKGQSFKFYGQEKLDGKWKPSANYGRPLIYDILDAYKKNEDVSVAIPQHDKAFADFILKVQKIPKERVREIFMPYAVRAEAQGVKVFRKDNSVKEDFNTEKFFEKMEKRQKTLKKDFDKLYLVARLTKVRVAGQQEEERKRKEEEARKKREEEERLRREEEEAARRAAAAAKKKPKKRKKKRKPETGLPIGDRVDDDIPFLDSQFLKEAIKAGADGKAFMIGGRDYHNAQALVYKVGGKGEGRGLHIEGRLSATGAEKLLTYLRRFAASAPEQHVVDDTTWPKVLTIVKSMKAHHDPNHSQYDGKTKPETAAAWKRQVSLFNQVIQKAGQQGDDETIAKYRHYLKSLHDLAKLDDDDELVIKPGALEAKFTPFVAPPKKMTKVETPEGFEEVEKIRRFEWKRKRTKTNKVYTFTRGEETQRYNDGSMYRFKMGDVELDFTPNTSDNPNAVQRKLVIRVKNEAKQNAKDLQKILKEFSERIGIETRPASKDDMEAAYLWKYAVQTLDEAQLQNFRRAHPQDDPVKKQVDGLLEEFALFHTKSGKPSDLRKKDTYNFDVKYQGDKGWAKFGTRFDMTEDEFNLSFHGVTLQHNLYTGIPGLIKNLTSKSGAMVSTEEKLRMGLVTPAKLGGSGMSGTSDRSSGGSDYHFARIARTNKLGHLVYNRRLLLELDSTSYVSDSYGAQRGDYRWKDRNKSLNEMKRGEDSGSNETNPYKQVDLAEHLEVVHVSSNEEKSEVIRLLKENGIETLGGEPLEERVVNISREGDFRAVIAGTPGKDFLP